MLPKQNKALKGTKAAMKIRTQGTLAIVTITLAFLVAMYAIAAFVIQPSFTNIESKEGYRNAQQVLNTLSYRLSLLKADVVDYSDWNDTYNYAKNNNTDYINGNFVDSTFENIKVNLVAITNNNRDLMYCQTFDLDNGTKLQTSNQTQLLILSSNALWTFPSLDSTVSGILLVDGQPMMVASAPILTTSCQGPPEGGMLFGKYLDSREIGELEQITSLNFTIVAMHNFEAKEQKMAESLLSNEQRILTKQDNSSLISEFMLVNDVNSNPTFVLELSQDRTTYQQGIWVEYVFLVAAISVTLTLGAAIAIFLEVGLVKPMTKLASQIENMPFNSETQRRSKFETDEISILANSAKNSLNKKLDAINEVSRMVGHDLRNPLSGIKGATYILKKNYGSKLDDKGNAQLKTIEQCIEYSDKIVRDLLEYSCEIKLERITTNAGKLVDSALSTFQPADNIGVKNEVENVSPLFVDPGQIQRVFSNLIKNAFEAMPNGGELKITSRKTGKDVAVAFSDSGTGITEGDLKKLWTPFFTTKAKGMGVGLSICKKIIESHGGKIKVESTLGKGTTFTVFLPELD